MVFINFLRIFYCLILFYLSFSIENFGGILEKKMEFWRKTGIFGGKMEFWKKKNGIEKCFLIARKKDFRNFTLPSLDLKNFIFFDF